MGLAIPLILFFLSAIALYSIYVVLNDRKLKRLPPEALKVSPNRWTDEDILETYKKLEDSPSSLLEGKLPPKTGRRYVILGGNGLLGGWIVLHLLQRGEDPRRIRILDIRPPVRQDLQKGLARDVDFIQVDVTNAEATDAAFQKPWPVIPGESTPDITVFHTAATIRFYERHPSLLHLSEKVNLKGTENIVAAAKKAGAKTFVYTSSGSVSVKRTRFWLWPWQKEPKYFVQAINDDDSLLPKRHEDFFSNYAVSKLTTEHFVRSVNGTPSGNGIIRTGCLRPGNGIFGPGGDILVAWILTKKVNPSWIPTIMQNFIYVENCSLAHLCYEQRLIELQNGSKNPDISGDSFTITDSGPVPLYGDVYNALVLLSQGSTSMIYLSPTLMLSIAHLIEGYYLTRHFLMNSSFAFLGQFLPPIVGDTVFLQPSMFALTNVHLLFDDSRARLSPEKGGLGYDSAITTLEAVCKVVVEHFKGDGKGTLRPLVDVHTDPGHGFDLTKPQFGTGEVYYLRPVHIANYFHDLNFRFVAVTMF
ncbi:NAD-P-binding protein [Abortiporus biennis]|nr:NAD-P-binding protein [Abortiporus biennis]